MQLLVGLSSLALVGIYVVPSATDYCIRFWNEESLVEFLDIIKSGVWKTPLIVLSSLIALINFASFIVVFMALLSIRSWIKTELAGLRRWRWCHDGLFVIYLVMFALLTIVEGLLAIIVYKLDPAVLFSKYSDAVIFYSVSFLNMFIYIAIYTVVNVMATIFAIFMFERMSHAVWSKKLQDEE